MFAFFGGLLVLWSRWWMCVHAPVALWMVAVNFANWPCPLTAWEKSRRDDVYNGGFIEHYWVAIFHRPVPPRRLSLAIGAAMLVVNVLVYAWVLRR